MLEIPLLYKDRRLEGETTLRQCQLVQLHLLYVFDAICKEYNLTYFLGGGTLLGAMRHGGFIPWDDDLDVGMPMKDYKKFLQIASTVLPNDVVLQTPTMYPHTAMPFAKLRDAYSFYYEGHQDQRGSDFNGIFIDIFPYEIMPRINVGLQKKIISCIARNWSAARGCLCYKTLTVWELSVRIILSKIHSGIALVARVFVEILRYFLPGKDLYLLFEMGFLCRFDVGKVFPTKNIKFEDGDFPIPNDPEAFLVSQYGNWREIPPPEKRPRHAKIILPTIAQDSFHSLEYP